MPSHYAGGVGDLERLLRQSQKQSPQRGLGAVVGGERDASAVNQMPEIPQDLVERFASETMSEDDKIALLEILTSLIAPSAEEVTGDQFLADGGKEAIRNRMMKELGFE